MTNAWVLSALWIGLALVATLVAIWFRVSTALSEIVVGTVAQLIIGAASGRGGLLGNTEWIVFLAGTGAIVLTFLAGADLDPAVFRTKWREALLIGLAGFFGPFLGCTLIAHFVLHWPIMASWRCGVALSTTSVAVVYAVMLELGFNRTLLRDLPRFELAVLPSPFTVTLWKVFGAGVLRSMIRAHLRESIVSDIKQELHLYGMALSTWSEQVVRKLEALVNSYADAYRVQLQRITGLHDKNTDLEQIESDLDLLLNWSASSVLKLETQRHEVREK